MFSCAELLYPIVGAPMAGGPTTPELAAAITQAGGLGFLAGGYRSPDQLEYDLRQVRQLTSGPIGVNLFVGHDQPPDLLALEQYRQLLVPLAEHYGVAVGSLHQGTDDCWIEKYHLLCDYAPPVVSFTFGCPSLEQIQHLHQRGITVWITVTSPHEAHQAYDHGADGLIIQSHRAGGHRATFSPHDRGSPLELDQLLRACYQDTNIDYIGAGGIAHHSQIDPLITGAANAVQIGTAFLLAHEAGTHPTYRNALMNPEFTHTIVTNVFTGRWARSLENDFTHLLEGYCPSLYPYIRHLGAPIYAAAAARNDPHGYPLWAGTEFRTHYHGSAAQILSQLLGNSS